MGLLAEAKSRRHISKDPNNTKWTRGTCTFGQKLLRAQGWEPGQYLGAQNAAHSGMHSATSGSHIRVAMKDDVTGLGFNQAKLDVVTGLDVFSDLLSRLNGKSSADIEGDRRTRLVMKTNLYVEQKWGPMRFVNGGLLVGQNMVERAGAGEVSEPIETTARDGTKGHIPKEKKSKKRKLAEVEAGNIDGGNDSKNARKRRKAERRAKKTTAKAVLDSAERDAGDDAETRRKRSKAKKNKSSTGEDVDSEQMSPHASTRNQSDKSRTSKSKREPCVSLTNESESRGATKPKRKKLEEKDEKESREKRRERTESRKTNSGHANGFEPVGTTDSEDIGTLMTTIEVSTPADSSTGTSMPRAGHNFVRSRFLAAKRQALLDTKALNQIFMVKS